jgi:hypothetical protein
MKLHRAMTRLSGRRRRAFLATIMAIVATQSWGAQPGGGSHGSLLRVTSSLGIPGAIDPLVDAHSLFVFANNSRDISLQTQASGFSGSARLVPVCCRDPRTGMSVSRPSSLTVALTPATLAFDRANSTRPATLRVSASSPVQAGTFVVTFRAFPTPRSELPVSGEVVVTVIPPPLPDGLPACPTIFQPPGTLPGLLPLGQLSTQLFAAKLMNPERTTPSFGIGGGKRAPGRGWQVDIEKATTLTPALSSSEAEVVFMNNAASTNTLYALHRDTCSRVASRYLVVGALQRGSFRISSADTTTLVLGEPNQDFYIFGEPNFWRLFGGRRVTFTSLPRTLRPT